MESIAAAEPQEPNWCRRMSRWPQHPPDDGLVQSEFVVEPCAPP